MGGLGADPGVERSRRGWDRRQGQIWRRVPVEAPLRGSWKGSHQGQAFRSRGSPVGLHLPSF